MESSEFEKTVNLVQAAQRGDQISKNRLFERYFSLVRQVVSLRIRKSLPRSHDLEDLVQEGLLKALQSLHQFKERSEGTFKNWLCRCVETRVIDVLRSERAAKRGKGKVRAMTELGPDSLSASIFADEDSTPSQILMRQELDQLVEEALLELEPHHREVIILRKLLGMSYPEIMEVMGFREEVNARQACSRALQKLREKLPA